jgi:hypothetical protein
MKRPSQGGSGSHSIDGSTVNAITYPDDTKISFVVL